MASSQFDVDAPTPPPRVPDRVLLGVTVGLLLLLVVAVVVALLVWHTPAMHPVTVPSAARA